MNFLFHSEHFESIQKWDVCFRGGKSSRLNAPANRLKNASPLALLLFPTGIGWRAQLEAGKFGSAPHPPPRLGHATGIRALIGSRRGLLQNRTVLTHCYPPLCPNSGTRNCTRAVLLSPPDVHAAVEQRSAGQTSGRHAAERTGHTNWRDERPPTRSGSREQHHRKQTRAPHTTAGGARGHRRRQRARRDCTAAGPAPAVAQAPGATNGVRPAALAMSPAKQGSERCEDRIPCAVNKPLFEPIGGGRGGMKGPQPLGQCRLGPAI